MLSLEIITQWVISHRWEIFISAVVFSISVKLVSFVWWRRKKTTLKLRARKEQEKFNPLTTVYNPRPFRRTNRQRK